VPILVTLEPVEDGRMMRRMREGQLNVHNNEGTLEEVRCITLKGNLMTVETLRIIIMIERNQGGLQRFVMDITVHRPGIQQ
jgi:hypothetical protein